MATANGEKYRERRAAFYQQNKARLLAQAKEYYLINAEKKRAVTAKWAEENKEKKKATDAAYYQRNKEAKKLYDIEYHKKNKDKKQLMAREWAKEHPEMRAVYHSNRRAKKKNSPGSHTAFQIQSLFEKQRGKCPICKSDISSGYHKDHIQPLSCNGTNDIANIQLLCPPCNLSKSTKDSVYFMQQRGFLL